MANDITQAADILIVGAAKVLRENALAARRVTTEYENAAAQMNQEIDIPVASPKSAKKITDPAAPPAGSDFAPGAVKIKLDQWDYESFSLSDREMAELKPGVFPAEAEEALRAVINSVDSFILNLAKQTPYYAIQTLNAATPPGIQFKDLAEAHRVLFNNRVPMDEEINLFIDGTTQAALLGMQEFIHLDKSGETEGLRRASLGARLNFAIFADQNVGTHTQSAITTGEVEGGGSPVPPATAATEQTITYTTAAGSVLVGDVVNIAGSGDHAVVAVSASPKTMTIRPVLRAQVADNAVIGYPTASGFASGKKHALNVGFHRRGIAFASRPLATTRPGSEIRVTADPLSGVAVRLEIRGKGKTTQFEWDVLYGGKVVRPELLVRWTKEFGL